MDKFYIVTPVFNAESTIERTILSILDQSQKSPISYHIQDGGSTDNTLAIVQRVLNEKNVPSNISITVASEPDAGMYDAIVKGFDKFDNKQGNDWLTWINADDYLETDALEIVTNCGKVDSSLDWIAGRVSILNQDGKRHVSSYDLHNSYILSGGVTDGKNWSFLQQEGTFFRAKCFDYVLKENVFNDLKYAGDWNLWRLMSQKFELSLVSKPLGTFCRTPGQLSQLYRRKYEQEIDSLVSKNDRENFILASHNKESLDVKVFDVDESKNITKRKHSLIGHLQYRKKLVSERLKEREKYRSQQQDVAERVVFDKGHVYLDYNWQYPAQTEKNAFEKLLGLEIVGGTCLLSFPWATYIDLHNNGKAKAEIFNLALEKIKKFLKKYNKVVTVCQHILMENYLELFQDIGVTDIFWSHKTKSKTSLADKYNIRTYPFPLFAVNYVENNLDNKRDILFNFVGAKSDQYYLTDTRNKIFKYLGNEPKSVVASREGWHFHDVVYNKQVNQTAEKNSDDTKRKADEFKELLVRSLFTLCPSGSGPNSIRLWEAIGSGSIPVILADTYEPPGNKSLWEQAVVFCEESDEAIRCLPDRLRKISDNEDKLYQMRNTMSQLWLLYGPDTFVTDLEMFLRENAYKSNSKPQNKVSYQFIEKLKNYPIDAIPKVILINCFLVRLLTDRDEFINFYEVTIKKDKDLKYILKKALASDINGILSGRLKKSGIEL